MKSYAHRGDKSVGESIKDLRTARGLSIRELATKTGLSASAISRWESGSRTPTVEHYNKMMTVLGAELIVIEK
jgi:transcriptional regulator with XRE-family HTH domain